MPLFTYVMTYRGRTAVHQQRRSNPVGFLASAVAAAFPELAREPHHAALIRVRATPMPGLADVWEARMPAGNGDLRIHVVATRG